MTDLIALMREGLVLALLLSVPPVGAAWFAQLATGLLQRAAQIPESTQLSHGPQLAAVLGAMLIASPWTVEQLASFAALVFEATATVGSS